MVTGSVAALELVENAKSWAGAIALKKKAGFFPVKVLINIG
jgi:hypothetical protein